MPIFIRHGYGGLLRVPGIHNHRSTVVPVGGPCFVGYAAKLIGHYRKAWSFTTASSGVIFGCPIGGVGIHLFAGICRGDTALSQVHTGLKGKLLSKKWEYRADSRKTSADFSAATTRLSSLRTTLLSWSYLRVRAHPSVPHWWYCTGWDTQG